MLAVYDSILKFCLRFKPLMLLVFFAHRGRYGLAVSTRSPRASSRRRTSASSRCRRRRARTSPSSAMVALQQQVADVFQRSPYVRSVSSVVGSGGNSANSGRLFVELKPKSERPALQVVLNDLRRELSPIAGIIDLHVAGAEPAPRRAVVAQPVPVSCCRRSTRTRSSPGREKVATAMEDDPHFADVSSDLEDSAQQVSLIVDRDKANALGISTNQLRSTLYSGFGTRQVSTIYETGDNYSVLLELDPAIALEPGPARHGVRALSLRQARPDRGVRGCERTVGRRAQHQPARAAAGGHDLLQPAAGRRPRRGGGAGGGVAQPSSDCPRRSRRPSPALPGCSSSALANQGLLILAAVLTIYIVLGILYESFIHPFTILTGLPSAAIGAFIALDAVRPWISA